LNKAEVLRLIDRTGLTRPELARKLGLQGRSSVDLWVFNAKIPEKHLVKIERLAKRGAVMPVAHRGPGRPRKDAVLATLDLRELSNDQLVAELSRRMKRKPGRKPLSARA
jgi:hypothetical protein